MNVDPRGMTLMEWAESMILPLGTLIVAPRLIHPDGWRDWANQIIQTAPVAALGPPQPDKFRDWQEWAFQFNQVVPL